MTDLSKYNIRPPSAHTKTNIIIIGGLGTGKTKCAIETSPRPVLGHSFDPTGFDTVRHLHDGENVILDTQFEGDNPKNPTKFALWDRVFNQMLRDKVFDNIGTFVLDSLTTWSDMAMNYVLAQAGRAGGAPGAYERNKFDSDWSRQKVIVFNSIQTILSLPCNVICTAHPSVFKDEVSGRTYSSPMLTGQLKDKVPLLFSEIYYTTSTYKLTTQVDGIWNARTRLGNKGQLDKFEEPNIINILKKVGLIE